MEIIYFSEILKEKYKIKKIDGNDRIIFESGINYRTNEVEIIRNVSDSLKESVHKIKRVFGGQVERIIGSKE